MVRFIMSCLYDFRAFRKSIYIPIWLDLLYNPAFSKSLARIYLHSNMVRFIIDAERR